MEQGQRWPESSPNLPSRSPELQDLALQTLDPLESPSSVPPDHSAHLTLPVSAAKKFPSSPPPEGTAAFRRHVLSFSFSF